MNADALFAARATPDARLVRLPEALASEAEAYAVQREIMARLGPIGGWKVGYAPQTGVFTCAPLPASHILTSPAQVPQAECPDRAVEAEIAVRIASDLPASGAPYTEAQVLAAIGSAHPAIELLQSRFADVDAMDKTSLLADSLSHYGLVLGPAIQGWQTIDLAAETVQVMVGGAEVKRATGNPAGAMLPLVTWMANVGAAWAGGLKAGQVVTTGSWTGKDSVGPGAHVAMVFPRCGTVEATYG